MRQLLAVALFGSILGFTASAALAAEGNSNPRLLQSHEDQTVTATTSTVQGAVAGPAASDADDVFVNNHEK